MTEGFLRRSVAVAQNRESVELTHAFWTLELPRPWVESVPGLLALFDRRGSIHDISAGGPELSNLLALLRAQGCLSYPDDRDAYTLREVRELFDHLSATWYGRYYAHPLWKRLASGSLSRNGLITWLLATYHLSRSVGMSAARSATHLERPELRVLFTRSALEEYSHCEEHFFPRQAGLALSEDDVRRSVRLPSSLAFDQQMLRVAEEDGVAHVLAGLFQETTARFHNEVRAFHRAVEAAYALPGLFVEWERHIEIDLREGHADEFAEALESDEHVTRLRVERSIRHAWFAYRFLLGALDDILDQDRDYGVTLLRLPVRGRMIDPSASALLAPYQSVLPGEAATLRAETAGRLGEELAELGLATPPRAEPKCAPPPEAIAFLQRDLSSSILRAMSFCTEHEEVLLLGRLSEGALAALPEGEASVATRGQPRSPHAMAMGNFIRELATDTRAFTFLLRHAVELPPPSLAPVVEGHGAWHGVGDDGVRLLDRFLATSHLDGTFADRLITLALQFTELYGRWITKASGEPPVDFFRD